MSFKKEDFFKSISRNGNVFVKFTIYSKRSSEQVEVIDKVVGNLSDKGVGLAILQRVLERFNISKLDIEDLVFSSMVKDRGIIDKKINWTKY